MHLFAKTEAEYVHRLQVVNPNLKKHRQILINKYVSVKFWLQYFNAMIASTLFGSFRIVVVAFDEILFAATQYCASPDASANCRTIVGLNCCEQTSLERHNARQE